MFTNILSLALWFVEFHAGHDMLFLSGFLQLRCTKRTKRLQKICIF